MREPNTCALPLSLPSHHDRSITHGRGDGHPRPLKWEGTGREKRSHKFLLRLSHRFSVKATPLTGRYRRFYAHHLAVLTRFVLSPCVHLYLRTCIFPCRPQPP